MAKPAAWPATAVDFFEFLKPQVPFLKQPNYLYD